tara:strand:- start:2476 stop:2622 length:147 start_codon:yes stop_codon:yes gene_type:complete
MHHVTVGIRTGITTNGIPENVCAAIGIDRYANRQGRWCIPAEIRIRPG